MKSHQADDTTSGVRHDATPASRQALQDDALTALAGNSPAARTLQRFQDLADTSPRMLRLQQAQAPLQRRPRPNDTGLPDRLKSGIESLSGMSMDHVRVHYGSAKPAQVQAHAYAQGSEIHVGPGQEKHLPHEAWHVVQQAQGRVRPTTQIRGLAVNDDVSLEGEADAMGARAAAGGGPAVQLQADASAAVGPAVAQLAILTWQGDAWVGGSGDGKVPHRPGKFEGEKFDDVTGEFVVEEIPQASDDAALKEEEAVVDAMPKKDYETMDLAEGVFSGTLEYGPNRNWADLHVTGATGGKADPTALARYFQRLHPLMLKHFKASGVPGVLEWHPTGAVVTKQIVELLGESLGSWSEWGKAKWEQKKRRDADKKQKREYNKLSQKINPEFVPEHMHFLHSLKSAKGLQVRPVGIPITPAARKILSDPSNNLTEQQMEELMSPDMTSDSPEGNAALASYQAILEDDDELAGPSLKIRLDFRQLPTLIKKLT